MNEDKFKSADPASVNPDLFNFLIRIIFVSVLILLAVRTVYAQSLWIDTDPYSSGQKIKIGSIIKVILKDGIKTEFQFEGSKEDSLTVKSIPDKKLIPENITYNADRNIVKKSRGKSKTMGKILGTMSAVVTEIDRDTGNLIISGSRESFFDKEKNVLRIGGQISPKDLEEDRTVSSDLIANLKLEFQGSVSKEMLEDPEVVIKENQNPDGSITYKAELSEKVKQMLILKNIKRMLGESE